MDLRPAFAVALVLVLLLGGGVLGKESLIKSYNNISPYTRPVKNAISNRAQIVGEAKDFVIQDAVQGLVEVSSNVSNGVRAITRSWGNQRILVGDVSIPVREITEGTLSIFKNYAQWVSDRISPPRRSYLAVNDFLEEGLIKDIQNLREGYFSANYFVEEKLSIVGGRASDSYFRVNDSLEEKLVQVPQNFKKGYFVANNFIEKKFSWGLKIFSSPFRAFWNLVTRPSGLTKKEFLEIEERETKNLMEGIRQEFQKLIREGIPLKEETIIREKEVITVKEVIEKKEVVEKRIIEVRELTPISKITKEIIKIDEEALKQVRKDIEYLEEEIVKRLYAPGGVISQTIYVTEPVRSPKIYQENGEIVLQTLGSGNVILSAATGLQLYGSQVVIESTSLLNPLIYLASNTRIGGDLTVTGSISGGALSASSISTDGALTAGNTTISGDLTVSGDLTISGAQAYSGAASFTASSTSPALKVTQNGSGNIVQFVDGNTNIFTIADGGYTTLATSPTTTNPAFLFQTSDTSNWPYNWSTGTATFLGINATSTFNGNFLDFQKSGTSLFSIADDGLVIANATITAASFVSADTDATVRKSGDQIMRGVAPIFGFDLPARCNTSCNSGTATATITRVVENNDDIFPAAYPGTTRKYQFSIRYADATTTATTKTTWDIATSSDPTYVDRFYLPPTASTDLAKGYATTTSNVSLPASDDWFLRVSTGHSGGYDLQVYDILLIGLDQVD